MALSSVAGERVRRSNFVYGSTKAGLDGFFLGLGEALRDSGVGVLVVRPGFVRSKMTEGLDEAPLAVTPEDVADAVVSAVKHRKELIWVPAAMRRGHVGAAARAAAAVPQAAALRFAARRVSRIAPWFSRWRSST